MVQYLCERFWLNFGLFQNIFLLIYAIDFNWSNISINKKIKLVQKWGWSLIDDFFIKKKNSLIFTCLAISTSSLVILDAIVRVHSHSLVKLGVPVEVSVALYGVELAVIQCYSSTKLFAKQEIVHTFHKSICAKMNTINSTEIWNRPADLTFCVDIRTSVEKYDALFFKKWTDCNHKKVSEY